MIQQIPNSIRIRLVHKPKNREHSELREWTLTVFNIFKSKTILLNWGMPIKMITLLTYIDRNCYFVTKLTKFIIFIICLHGLGRTTGTKHFMMPSGLVNRKPAVNLGWSLQLTIPNVTTTTIAIKASRMNCSLDKLQNKSLFIPKCQEHLR